MANGKAQTRTAAIETEEMEAFRRSVRETVSLIGGLIFLPFIFLLGAAHGIRAGIFEGLKKTLKIYRDFNARG